MYQDGESPRRRDSWYRAAYNWLKRSVYSDVLADINAFNICTQILGAPWTGMLAAVGLTQYGAGTMKKVPTYSATDVVTTVQQMAFRASPLAAPLAVMLPVQSNAAGTGGDVLSYGRGTQVSGNNYDTGNTNQGTRLTYVEPLYTGSDGLSHYINYNSTPAFVKSLNNLIYFDCGGITHAAPSAATWALLEKKLLVGRYDADNVVTATKYGDLWVNGAQTDGLRATAYSPTAPLATGYLGSFNGAYASHLEYFDFLFDDIWSDADLALVYGAGTVVSPDRVMKNPECLKMLWAPGLRAASGAVAGATVNEGAFWNKRPYNSGTNANGNRAVNGNFETALSTEWANGGTGILTRATDAAGLVGLYDTAYGLLTNTGGVNGYCVQTIAGFSATNEVRISLPIANIDATSAQVDVYSGTSGDEYDALLCTWSTASTTVVKFESSVTVPTGHDRITVGITAIGADGKKIRFDNLDVRSNLAVNGGMEGTYAKTGSAIHTSTAATTTYSATRATDSTAWTLTNAVVGMIVEGDGGKYGFITAIGANYVDVAAWVGGTPTNGQAANVYSALAPGWTLQGAPRCYRAVGSSGTYAQGVVGTDISNYLKQVITVVNGTWYSIFGKLKIASGGGSMTWGASNLSPSLSSSSATFAQSSGIFRSSTTSNTTYFYGSSTATNFVVDDITLIPLSSVTMTFTAGGRSETNGTNDFGGDTNQIPSAGNLSLVGSVVGTFTPRGWNGADGRTHYAIDTTAVSNCRFIVYKSATNNFGIYITDAAGGLKGRLLATTALTMPNNTLVRWGVSWDAAGTFLGHVNGVALDTNSGAGTGIMASLPTPLFLGSSNASISQLDATDHKMQFFDTAKSVLELTTLSNAL